MFGRLFDMRKLFYICALFTIVGCAQPPQVGYEVEYNVLDVEYENHTYILFDNLNGSLSAIHSPNCKCKNQ